MILQALATLYSTLESKGILEKPGWQYGNVSYALKLNDDGKVVKLVPLMIPVMRGKKEVLGPSSLKIPAQVKRSSGVNPNYLCENSSYFLAADNKGKPKRALECFQACGQLHSRLLTEVDHPAAKAILKFFENPDPAQLIKAAVFKDSLDDILNGANLVFMYGNEYAQEIPELQQAWDAAYSDDGGSATGICLVTGNRAPVARLHPSIKGVRDAQSSGASLVSFNAPAFESYGRDNAQGLNAPVSQNAAFAYGAALNWLISQPKNRSFLGDSTVVYWAEDGESAYSDCFSSFFGGNTITEDELERVVQNLCSGKNVFWNDIPLNPDNHFYILGLAPNASRLSVRFFIQDKFGDIITKINRHYDRLRIDGSDRDRHESMSTWWLMNETVNQHSSTKSPSPQMAGSLIRSILTDTYYPATMMNQLQLRIHAEGIISHRRAAMIKAYLLKNTAGTANYISYKEVLEVKLNEDSIYPAYVLGRLFSVLEGLQETANGKSTIRDRYFNSACATPAIVFPILIRLAQAHLKKLSTGGRIYYEQQLTSLACKLDHAYPQRLNLNDQGIFQLGYYHQTQKRFTKKEEK